MPKPNLSQAELVIHTPVQLPINGFRCERWSNLCFPHSCMVSFVPADTGAHALRLTLQLAEAFKRFVRGTSPSSTFSECLGPGPSGCRCHDTSSTRCVLVLVSDGHHANDYSGTIATWAREFTQKSARYHFLAACPKGGHGALVNSLPQPLNSLRAFEWVRSPTEALSSVVAAAGIASEDHRVFISYSQMDGRDHADDLFEALTARGYDVFLDRARIGVGASIPYQIEHELGHKSILVVLETPLAGRSVWVPKEIGIASRTRMGIIALHFPHGWLFPEIGRRRRREVSTDFNDRLAQNTKDSICERIAEVHDRWLIRRRYQMQLVLSNALLVEGLVNHRLTPQGHIDVVANWQTPYRECSIRPTPRLPELNDFRMLDALSNGRPPVDSAIIAPGAFAIAPRQDEMRWLSDRLNVPIFDESGIVSVAKQLADKSEVRLHHD